MRFPVWAPLFATAVIAAIAVPISSSQAATRTAAGPPAATKTSCSGLTPGSYVPGPSTTGVRAGSVLKTIQGDLNITAAGTYENLDVHGFVNVKAANVTIRNSKVRGGVAIGGRGLINSTDARVSHLLVEGVELVPDHPSYWLDGILGHDYTAKCVNVYRTVDGFGVFKTQDPGGPTNVTITQSFVHELSYFSPDPTHPDNRTHNDCIQIQGGSGDVVTYNRLHAYYSSKAGTLPTPRPQSMSAIMLNNNVGKTTNVLVVGNRIDGGEIAINGGGLGKYAAADNLGTFWRNTFDRTQFYATHTIDLDAAVTKVDTGDGTSNQNVYTDGTAIKVRHNA